MKTLLSFLLLSLLSINAFAESLVVGAGQKMTITAARQSLTLDSLVMEDNSTIDFAPDVSHWEVFAREASFGNNTTINGRGHDGVNGQDGKANYAVLAPRLKINDIKSRALIIHVGGDNYSDDPALLGGGGARIACGAIKG